MRLNAWGQCSHWNTYSQSCTVMSHDEREETESTNKINIRHYWLQAVDSCYWTRSTVILNVAFWTTNAWVVNYTNLQQQHTHVEQFCLWKSECTDSTLFFNSLLPLTKLCKYLEKKTVKWCNKTMYSYIQFDGKVLPL